MAFKIVRNDITKMNTEAIVNTANDQVTVGAGCDIAIYNAAGYDELLAYRKEKIGVVQEGEVFITPGFGLPAKYIIHAVSPQYRGGEEGEEEKLRSCYRKSLALAKENGIRSIAFPLIATGSFSYPKEEGMRIAVDEINAFLLHNEMDVILVVFGTRETALGERIYPNLEAYIDHHYVYARREEEYGDSHFGSIPRTDARYSAYAEARADMETRLEKNRRGIFASRMFSAKALSSGSADSNPAERMEDADGPCASEKMLPAEGTDFTEEHESNLKERMTHLSDTFSEYLMYLIETKGMTNVEVYKRALVDKKAFSKIKNDSKHRPQKITAMCLCVGARLNLDEAKDLLGRAGYALSPSDKTDVIFSYFIENQIYDMIELDIMLEEYGEKCLIS